jgi:hypothetical protein
MLGAVKDEDEGGKAPLFRTLARGWKSLAPEKRERLTLSSAAPADEKPKSTRGWISKPRHIYAHHKIDKPKPASAWNPWLWVK